MEMFNIYTIQYDKLTKLKKKKKKLRIKKTNL